MCRSSSTSRMTRSDAGPMPEFAAASSGSRPASGSGCERIAAAARLKPNICGRPGWTIGQISQQSADHRIGVIEEGRLVHRSGIDRGPRRISGATQQPANLVGALLGLEAALLELRAGALSALVEQSAPAVPRARRIRRELESHSTRCLRSLPTAPQRDFRLNRRGRYGSGSAEPQRRLHLEQHAVAIGTGIRRRLAQARHSSLPGVVATRDLHFGVQGRRNLECDRPGAASP